MTRKKSKTVLRAANLTNLLKSVCALEKSVFRLGDFQRAYFRANGYKIGRKTAEDYFYTATQMGLIKKKRNVYQISKVEAEILCAYLRNNKTIELNETIFNILKSKIEPFRRFLQFLQAPRTKLQLNDRFNPHSAGTMLKWGLDLGAIDEDKFNKRYFLKRKPEKPVDVETFWKVLENVHEKERKTDFVGIESAFVKIPDLRETVRALLGFTREDFDRCLHMVLDNDKYGHRIELSGAPVIYIEREKKEDRHGIEYKYPFSYKGKKYYFLAIHK